MKNSARLSNDVLLRRAKEFDAMAARAEVRRARAIARGVKREADGAQCTIDEAQANARLLRAKMNSDN